MRRVRLFVAISLDGHIAGPNGEVDWLFSDRDYGMSQFYSSVDTVLMGRRTYDFMLLHGETSYRGKKNYVFSRQTITVSSPEVEWVSEDAVAFVESLRREKGRDIWLVGGADLFVTLLEKGLIDDVILAIHPILLGDGISLFPRRFDTLTLELRDVTTYSTGLVLASYRLRRTGRPGARTVRDAAGS
jgi:dihydrofolate reductase